MRWLLVILWTIVETALQSSRIATLTVENIMTIPQVVVAVVLLQPQTTGLYAAV
jgi:hypothetical protein